MTVFRWGLVGPGAIARRFADAVQRMDGSELAAVCGRDAARAAAFAEHWTRDGQAPPRVATDLAALLADPRVDAVYVATPHAQHGATIRACLEAGKPVLCEKPLVPNRAEAAALIALARERRVFLMEALWTRFLPAYAVLERWLKAGAIGPVTGLQSSFCFAAPYDETNASSRLYDPAQAGGALLDIGIYNLSVTRWVLEQARGACPELAELQVAGKLAPTGVDERVAATLVFGAGADLITAQFVCGFDASADNALRIFGTEGQILLPRTFWEATEAILELDGQPPERVAAPFAINGFEGEIAEAQACIRAGALESARISHAETLATLGWMDEIRRRLGVRYPFE